MNDLILYSQIILVTIRIIGLSVSIEFYYDIKKNNFILFTLSWISWILSSLLALVSFFWGDQPINQILLVLNVLFTSLGVIFYLWGINIYFLSINPRLMTLSIFSAWSTHDEPVWSNRDQNTAMKIYMILRFRIAFFPLGLKTSRLYCFTPTGGIATKTFLPNQKTNVAIKKSTPKGVPINRRNIEVGTPAICKSNSIAVNKPNRREKLMIIISKDLIILSFS